MLRELAARGVLRPESSEGRWELRAGGGTTAAIKQNKKAKTGLVARDRDDSFRMSRPGAGATGNQS